MARWACSSCGERHPREFDACWNCGCSPVGEPDPTFQVADFIDPRGLPTIDSDEPRLAYPPLKNHVSLRLLFGLTTFCGLLSAIFLTTPQGREAVAMLIFINILWLLFMLFMMGIAYIAASIVTPDADECRMESPNATTDIKPTVDDAAEIDATPRPTA
jgi:phage shock protein PspC (stress-responsive transcriptional regulator)